MHFGELNLRVNSLIRGLQASGLVAGDRLVLYGGNSRAVFELKSAAHHVGLSYVPVNWDFTLNMIAWWGPCVHEYYGSTEGAIVTGISSTEWLQRPGSVGRVINLTDVFILRDDGNPAPTGEQGAIYMRHRLGLGLRYSNDAAKTESAHRGEG